MSLLKRLSCLVSTATSALGLMSCMASAETMLTFCFDPYPPYTYASGGKITGGLKVDLLQAVVSKIEGVSAEVQMLPWKRCQVQAEAGNVDGILPLFKSADRERFLAFTDATFEESYNFWFSTERFPDGFEWDGRVESVAGLRLGVLTGAFVSHELIAGLGSDKSIVWVKDIESLMQMLKFGRVDLAVSDRLVGHHTVRQNGWQDSLRPVDPDITSKPAHFGLSRLTGAEAYLEDFNRALGELKRDGTIDDMLRSTR
ncbi:substrate-binding periplasmic protein [Leisingera sp. XS_AS12]|uniref:substrate-binding periplasmic protein n=1 Tax=Leisingera sp. XS_AS12 TaxID=3241294 RepID=UPI003518EB54